MEGPLLCTLHKNHIMKLTEKYTTDFFEVLSMNLKQAAQHRGGARSGPIEGLKLLTGG